MADTPKLRGTYSSTPERRYVSRAKYTASGRDIDEELDKSKAYTAGNGIEITDENVINADIKVLEVANITGLTTEQCESLNVGDVVVKLTSNQKHTYTVSYKEHHVGMCLTYVDASVSETVSYDYVGNAWVYNSIDITPLKNVVANPVLAGTEEDLTGLQVGDTKFKVPQGGGGGSGLPVIYQPLLSILNTFEQVGLTGEVQHVIMSTELLKDLAIEKGLITNETLMEEHKAFSLRFELPLISADNSTPPNGTIISIFIDYDPSSSPADAKITGYCNGFDWNEELDIIPKGDITTWAEALDAMGTLDLGCKDDIVGVGSWIIENHMNRYSPIFISIILSYTDADDNEHFVAISCDEFASLFITNND